MTIGQLLRQEQHARSLSERELGLLLVNKDTGEPCAQAVLNRWMNGDNLPSRAYYPAIGRLLGLTTQAVAIKVGQEREKRSRRSTDERLDALEAQLAEIRRLLSDVLPPRRR